MQKKWKHGELVTVVTVNKGLPVWSKEQDAAKSWAGEIIGPSLIGRGWWNVRRDTPSGAPNGSVFAVPEGEIGPRKC